MKKCQSIEGLRGMTVVVIVLFHVLYRYNQLYCHYSDSSLVFISKWGEIGVSIFLMISAFFLIENKKKSHFQYAKTKYIRLWPLYFLSISIVFFVTRFILLPERTVSAVDYLLNIFFINGFIGTPYVDGAHWYLTTLIAMYLVYRLSTQFHLEKKYYWTGIWIIMAFAVKLLLSITKINAFSMVYQLLGGDFVGLASLGIIARQIQLRKEKLSKKDIIFIVACVLAGLGYAIILNSVWRIIGAVLGLLLLYVCLKYDPFILRMKWLVFFGAISYPLYLIHQNISYIIMLNLDGILPTPAIRIIALMVVVGFACLLHLTDSILMSLINKKEKREVLQHGN